MDSIVTIVTPTFNRAYKLSDLYKSILLQTANNFIWLIVDDGSTDNTEEIVTGWLNEKKITIIYKKKLNGGKHTALNYSYQFVTTPLIFIVDSDDALTPNAISIVEDKYNKYKTEADLCGFSFMRGNSKEKYLSSKDIPFNNLKESFIECRINRKIGGDMAEVWFTHCLKEYPFPEIENEKFISEDVVWIKMAEKYKLRFYNDVIYISDYLGDGLTYNRRKNNIAAPKGCVMRADLFLRTDIVLSQKIKAMLQYIIYGKFAGYKLTSLFKKSPIKSLFVIFFLPAMLYYFKWKRLYT